MLSHAAVQQALVIGIPHKTQGERLMGVVMLKESADDVTEKELEKFVEERVEDHKRWLITDNNWCSILIK